VEEQNEQSLSDKQVERIQTKLVDTSEPVDIQEGLLETGWIRKRLVLGDYMFFNHEFKKVGIERKTVDDLLMSIGDRLSGQLEACLDFYDETILLIEGSWRTVSAEDNMVSYRGIERSTWKMVWNYLRQRQRSGVTLELTIDNGHTIKRLNELFALYQQPYSTSGNTKRFDDDRVLAFPSGCRGKTAQMCLGVFGSLELVSKASVERFDDLPDIGTKKAQRIWEHFHKCTPKLSESDYKLFKEAVEGEQGRLV
jgi:ERCC4-type nuclease